MAIHTRFTLALQSRLDVALLAHLRDVVKDQAEELERMREALSMADTAAGMWETLHHAAIEARPVCLTEQGQIIILDRP